MNPRRLKFRLALPPEAQPDLSRQMVRASPAFDTLGLEVKLKPIGRADGCGGNSPLQTNRVQKVNSLGSQVADMVRRETISETGTRRKHRRQESRGAPVITRPAPTPRVT